MTFLCSGLCPGPTNQWYVIRTWTINIYWRFSPLSRELSQNHHWYIFDSKYFTLLLCHCDIYNCGRQITFSIFGYFSTIFIFIFTGLEWREQCVLPSKLGTDIILICQLYQSRLKGLLCSAICFTLATFIIVQLLPTL